MTVRKIPLVFHRGIDRLVGTLTTPPWPGPWPILLMVPPTSQHGDQGAFDAYSARLAAAGIAAFSYQIAQPEGARGASRAALGATPSIAECAQAVIAAEGAVRAELGPKTGPITVAAAGDGGWAALLAARGALHGRLERLVLLDVPTRGDLEAHLGGISRELAELGFGADEIALARVIQTQRLRRVGAGEQIDAVLDREAPCWGTAWYPLLPVYESGDALALIQRALHDSRPDLRALVSAEGDRVSPRILIVANAVQGRDLLGLDDEDLPWVEGPSCPHLAITVAGEGGDDSWATPGVLEVVIGRILTSDSSAPATVGHPESAESSAASSTSGRRAAPIPLRDGANAQAETPRPNPFVDLTRAELPWILTHELRSRAPGLEEPARS